MYLFKDYVILKMFTKKHFKNLFGYFRQVLLSFCVYVANGDLIKTCVGSLRSEVLRKLHCGLKFHKNK